MKCLEVTILPFQEGADLGRGATHDNLEVSIMQNVERLIVCTLERMFPDEVQKLYQAYDRLSDEEAKLYTVEQYILVHMPDAFTVRTDSFKEVDQARRMCEKAKLFTPETCARLWKKRYPTGFPRLDLALGGGLSEGVLYLGAIASLGKSTFVLQMADHMASQGIPVVYVSMEMGGDYLTSKLVGMHTFLASYKTGDRRAKTCNFLLSEAMRDMDEREQASVLEASRIVAELGKNITVWDDRSSAMTVDKIERYIDEYVMAYGTCPVLIIDYLQILSAPRELQGCTDKQAVDYNVAKFRAISAKYHVPVIVISSFNRDNYNTKVGLQSFKDSGNIEYSGDTLIGLQLTGVGDKNFDVDAAKAAYPRKVDLIILKQRYGAAGVRIPYNFYTTYNYFEEAKLEELPRKTPIPFEEGNQRKVKGYAESKSKTEIVF